MIDMQAESLITISQAARLVPPGRQGKPTHVATIHRWINQGVRGVRLDAIRLGGRWLTSREALQRFAQALTTPLVTLPPPCELHRKQEGVEQVLNRLGL
jgi:hypothetical protein